MVDLAWRLLRQGYDAVAAERAARGFADDFEGRLLGRRAVVVRSGGGARAFYDQSLVRRHGAVPPPLAWLLFGRGTVHGLDAPEHAERKSMFLEVLAPDRPMSLAAAVDAELRARVARWPGHEVRVHDELVLAYGRAVQGWVGVPMDDRTDARSRQLAQVVDGFGFAGPAYGRAWCARVAADRWAAALVEAARGGHVGLEPGSVLDAIAASEMPPRTAGVELLNIVRPTIAVAWLGTFAALRFAEHTGWRSRLAAPDGDGARDRLSFAQEVRRTTPFVPVLAGRVRHPAALGDLQLHEDDRLVLDVHGINRDPVRWPDPDTFDPARFLTAEAGAFDLVPQGGGSPDTGHRCPGESVALLLLDTTLRVLPLVDYTVVDGSVDLTRMPTLPGDGLVIRVPRRAGSPVVQIRIR